MHYNIQMINKAGDLARRHTNSLKVRKVDKHCLYKSEQGVVRGVILVPND